MDIASRITFILLAITFITESAAYYAAVRFHNNIIVYTIYSIIEIGLASLYFNYSVKSLYKRHIGIYIAIAGVAVGIINSIWFQSARLTDSDFMLVEGLLIMALAMYALIQLLLDDSFINFKFNPNFWFAFLQLFFWSTTLPIWLLYDHLTSLLGNNKWIVDFSLYLISMITNIGFGLVFIFYPTMKKRYEYHE